MKDLYKWCGFVLVNSMAGVGSGGTLAGIGRFLK
jgi:cysteine synthase